MHKDRPPGLFDFAERSVRYMIGFWFVVGIFLSILVQTGVLVWRSDFSGPRVKPNQDALEAATAAQRAAAGKTPPPDPPAAIRY
jgi:hypothetical protein